MIYFGNMHNPLIILNVRIHASQMLNILLNGTPSFQFNNYETERLYEKFVEFKCHCKNEKCG